MRPDVNEDVRNRNNKVELEGIVVSNPEFHHSTYGEDIYSFMLNIARLNSDTSDTLRVEVSNRLVNIDEIRKGAGVRVLGQFRSFNKASDTGKRTLELSVFARDLEFIDEVNNVNTISLEGYLCKDANFRVTPKGREIGDLLVAINRNYGKSDYIPCITWGRNARFSSNLDIGTGVVLEGRIQSRTYVKRINDTESEERTAYEVSVSKITIFKDGDSEEV